MAIIPADEKVFMVSNGTNTTYGGSAALQAMNQWYTMEDVTNTVRPYKVYTVLLNQSGGDDLISVGQDENIFAGITYYIENNDANFNFIPYGAPNNNVGTYFVCTQDAYINTFDVLNLQYNTGAPVATVLENTIGNIWFTYSTEGLYFIESDGLFSTSNKSCVAHSGATSDDGGYTSFFVYSNLSDTNDIKILVTNVAGFTSNSALNAYLIEIRVYN